MRVRLGCYTAWLNNAPQVVANSRIQREKFGVWSEANLFSVFSLWRLYLFLGKGPRHLRHLELLLAHWFIYIIVSLT
jgi:hypothetical protein